MDLPVPTPPTTVQLRDVIAADLPIFFAHQQDLEATRMAAFPAREHEAFMAHWARVLADPTVITQTILADGQVAGNVVSFVVDGEREVGYWLGRAYWGMGVATRALAAFLTQVTERPLYAHVVKHNHGSRRVLEKCGFTVCAEATVEDGGSLIEERILILRAGARPTPAGPQ